MTDRELPISICLISGNNLAVKITEMYTQVYIRCALIVQYSNGYFITHFRDAWHTTKTIYQCTQTFLIVISTLFNYDKSCYTCVRLYMSIWFMSGNNVSVRSTEMYTKIYIRLRAYMLCINSAIFERVLHCTFQSCMT